MKKQIVSGEEWKQQTLNSIKPYVKNCMRYIKRRLSASTFTTTSWPEWNLIDSAWHAGNPCLRHDKWPVLFKLIDQIRMSDWNLREIAKLRHQMN